MLKDWNVFISEVTGSEIKWNSTQSGRSKDCKCKHYVVDTSSNSNGIFVCTIDPCFADGLRLNQGLKNEKHIVILSESICLHEKPRQI